MSTLSAASEEAGRMKKGVRAVVGRPAVCPRSAISLSPPRGRESRVEWLVLLRLRHLRETDSPPSPRCRSHLREIRETNGPLRYWVVKVMKENDGTTS